MGKLRLANLSEVLQTLQWTELTQPCDYTKHQCIVFVKWVNCMLDELYLDKAGIQKKKKKRKKE